MFCGAYIQTTCIQLYVVAGEFLMKQILWIRNDIQAVATGRSVISVICNFCTKLDRWNVSAKRHRLDNGNTFLIDIKHAKSQFFNPNVIEIV